MPCSARKLYGSGDIDLTSTVLTLALAGAVLAGVDQIDIPEVEDGGVAVDAATQNPQVIPAVCTAYAPTGQRTATGIWPTWGVVATDPSVLPMGTRMTISGLDGTFVAADTGGGVRGAHVDIYMPSYAAAISYGRRPCTVQVLR